MAILPDTIYPATTKNVVALTRVTGKWALGVIQKQEHASLTLLRYRGYCLGITNQHVVQDYARPGDVVFEIALNRTLAIPGRLVFKSTGQEIDLPRDLAIFALHEPSVRAGGKEPIELPILDRRLQIGQSAMAVGFPGHEKFSRSPEVVAHPAYHVVATCRTFRPNSIILQDTVTDAPSRRIEFGGLSGGPIFGLEETGWFFAGIIYEGRGFSDTTPATNEIWIFGFPLDNPTLDRLIGHLDDKMLNVQPLKPVIRLHLK